MSERFDVVVVGTGHAGAQCAQALRRLGFAGSIALVGDETELPYERPPLSKDYLLGERSFARMLIRPADFWAERGIVFRLGRRVESVDADAHRVGIAGGEAIVYGQLVWATGGAPRRLGCSGGELDDVHIVRSRADVDRLRQGLDEARRIVVIGGGYIGLEAAAALVRLGKEVTLVEAADRVLSRVAGVAISRFFEAEHRARGVALQLSARVECIETRAGRADAVRLVDGQRLACDRTVVGIGIDASVEPLMLAGARGDDGVTVDAYGHTSLPDVWAAGDCASHVNAFADGAAIRLESVQNANDQATTVAHAIVGDRRPYDAVPWFWSNQYDLRLQTAGLSAGHDEAVIRGDPQSRSFSVVYLRRGQMIAIDCVNKTRDFVDGRELLATKVTPVPGRLAEAGVPLRERVGA